MPVRIGNALRNGGIYNLRQILAMSGDELMTAIARGQRHKAGGERRKQEAFWYLISRLGELDSNPKWSKVFLEWREAHNAYDCDAMNCKITDISDIF